ncbi:hypothetical protein METBISCDRAFT_15152 [Metschnikowia bicuspidata]|uniref:GDP/GTP exchange factor Sec2 N-terminal domain-containing protein n=1 Tax=Metschnikowia bicuspidata TaxID=27322 RepID=A0A4P9ZDB3_9ASCO|nr:hypothetical protein METBISCDRAFT_15152 [Metschnikowia bicuspidata]
MAEEDLHARLAEEVAVLSTKLVTEVARLLLLEETVHLLRRENHGLRQQLDVLRDIEEAHATAAAEAAELSAAVQAVTDERNTALAKNAQLEAEVEDLTATLFNEANEMVSSASRETYNFKVKNRKLIEELGEKDILILDLQRQLHDLKRLIETMEEESRERERKHERERDRERRDAGRNADRDAADEGVDLLVYSPRACSIRFDLPMYQRDFRAFVYQLVRPDFVFELGSLKTLRYFRKIWNDEIEPSLDVPAPMGSFINRWAVKSFWLFLVEGKARIEPVSGVNETFKVSYKGPKTGLEVPIALRDPCSFCGEQNETRLEHARLYSVKLYSSARDTRDAVGETTVDVGGEPHHVVGLYPLCNYCLVKLRAVCEFFAKLRLIHSNIYKLTPSSVADAAVSGFQFKRAADAVETPKVIWADEPVLVKLYLLLLGIRAKIFWSRTGFWDTEDDVECLSVEDIRLDVFRDFVATNVSFQEFRLEAVGLAQSGAGDSGVGGVGERGVGVVEKLTEGEGAGTDAVMRSDRVLQEVDHAEQLLKEYAEVAGAGSEHAVTHPTELKIPEEIPENKLSKETEKTCSEKSSQGASETPKDASKPAVPLTRHKSTSKQLKKKINRDLDSSMEMLKENFE